MPECYKYLNKPVPEEAVDSQQFFAGEKIFILGLFRFLVNDQNIVTFTYKRKQEPQSEDNR